MPPDEVRLRHMLDAARKTLAFTNGRSRNDLDANEQLTLAALTGAPAASASAWRGDLSTAKKDWFV